MNKYLFDNNNFKIGDIAEFTYGDVISINASRLTVRKKISDYIKISIATKLEYIGTFIDINHKSKGPYKIFHIIETGEHIYVRPYSNGFYVGYVLGEFEEYKQNMIDDKFIFISDEIAYYNR